MAEILRRFVTKIVGLDRLAPTTSFRLTNNRFMRFLVAGGVNAFFSIAVFSVSILAGGEVWLALIVTMIAGIAFNFLTTGGYAFRELSLRNFPRFLICYLLLYVINLGLFELVSAFLSNKFIAQAIITLPVGLLSYVLLARFVFLSK